MLILTPSSSTHFTSEENEVDPSYNNQNLEVAQSRHEIIRADMTERVWNRRTIPGSSET